jgi:hypothetical protein
LLNPGYGCIAAAPCVGGSGQRGAVAGNVVAAPAERNLPAA